MLTEFLCTALHNCFGLAGSLLEASVSSQPKDSRFTFNCNVKSVLMKALGSVRELYKVRVVIQ